MGSRAEGRRCDRRTADFWRPHSSPGVGRLSIVFRGDFRARPGAWERPSTEGRSPLSKVEIPGAFAYIRRDLCRPDGLRPRQAVFSLRLR